MNGLVVVATKLEAEALSIRQKSDLIVSGLGSVSAALATQGFIFQKRPDFIISAGIAGAYPGCEIKMTEIVVGSQAIYADLGAEDGENFLSLIDLGFSIDPNDQNYNILATSSLSKALSENIGAHYGSILTVNTVTGSSRSMNKIKSRWPSALAEAMEGAGVSHASMLYEIPFFEIRSISNMVGPRDKSGWDIKGSLETLNIAVNKAIDFIKQSQIV